MKYQIYAYDEDNNLNHAGIRDFRPSVTAEKLRKSEESWQKWRSQYPAYNNKASVLFAVWPVGNIELKTMIDLRLFKARKEVPK